MKISTEWPPNIEEIREHFDVSKDVLFCYGDTIYNPLNIKPRPDLVAHEKIHSKQQGNDPDGWWRKYVDDPKFRVEQEAQAYGAQAKHIQKRAGYAAAKRAVASFADFLSSPVYGSSISRMDAYVMISHNWICA